MSSETDISIENVIPYLLEKSERKFGFFSINYILINCKISELLDFIRDYGISIPDKSFISRLEYIKHIVLHLTNVYYATDWQKKFEDPLEYCGYAIINSRTFKKYLYHLDFIAKQDLIETFADHCADLEITVHNTTTDSITPKMDMYLSMKKSKVKTGAVFVMNGVNFTNGTYQETKKSIVDASNVASWKIFVTTPIGVLKIGLKNLISDMRKLNCWLYVVDPSRKIVYGVIKGRKNEDLDPKKRNEFIKKLPREPMRAPSHIIKLSDYYYNETDSYESMNFRLFDIYNDVDHNKLMLKESEKPKYSEIFRDLIIMEKTSGIPIINYTSENFKAQALVSGFLSAMDSFVSQIGGSKMEEISYKGFYVQASYGRYIELICFLFKPSDPSFKERLNYLTNLFETLYHEEIEIFRKTGDTNLFNEEEILLIMKEILDI
ncbi:MAG: hypothetical protein JSV62_07990 [Promethearchaeota archaeon]|nr:MAG: hypothetical protein JSV62_07990 [Candidatus Lokiarchaeota archaeon]